MPADQEQDTVRSIVERRVGHRPISVDAILGHGSVNRVYAVRLPAQVVVVRVNDKPTVRAEFLKEKICADIARANRIRTPKILVVGCDRGITFSIQEHVPGTSGKFDTQSHAAIYQMLGRTARVLHSVKPRGFGDRYDEEQQAFTGFSASWTSHLDYHLDQLASDDPLIALGVYAVADQPRLRALLSGLHHVDFAFGLVHGDLSLRNVICEPGGGFSLIDWGSAHVGIVPQSEFVELLRHHEPESLAIRSFCEGYGLTAHDLERISPALATLSLLRALDTLRWAISNNPGRVPDLVRTAQKAFGNSP